MMLIQMRRMAEHKHRTAEEVIEHLKTQWKVFRDEYAIALEEASMVKRGMREEEKDVAFSLYLKEMGSSVLTLEDLIREGLKEHAKRSKMPDDEIARLAEEARKRSEDLLRGSDEPQGLRS